MYYIKVLVHVHCIDVFEYHQNNEFALVSSYLISVFDYDPRVRTSSFGALGPKFSFWCSTMRGVRGLQVQTFYSPIKYKMFGTKKVFRYMYQRCSADRFH